MDKKQLSAIISDVYKHLTPFKVSVFLKNEDIATIRVISNSFQGMTFSARTKLLNDELAKQQDEIFHQRIYIFEAFTQDEIKQLSSEESHSNESSSSGGFSESAKELE
jgi:stress-induced morphogen